LIIILAIDGKFYEKYASIILLFLFIISWSFGKTIAGQRCWYAIEAYNTTSEFAKAATSLALAKFLSDSQIKKEVNRQMQAHWYFYQYPLILPQPDL
jgi:rod shape determining protein RodA